MNEIALFIVGISVLWIALAVWRLSRSTSRRAGILTLIVVALLATAAWTWTTVWQGGSQRAFHDTYYVIAPANYVLTLGAIYVLGGAVWWVIHAMAPGYWPRLGQVVFWLMHLGVGLTLLPLVSFGALPMLLSAYLSPVGSMLAVAALAFTVAAFAMAAWQRLRGTS